MMSIRNSIFAAGVLALLNASLAFAQQTTDQQKCLNALNKDGGAVARTQGKENVGCLKGAGKGTIASPQTCIGADTKGKVAKAQGKTTADETKSCGTAPSFGYTSAAAVNTGAKQAELDLNADVYGANMDTAALSCANSKPRCICQQKVSKIVEQLAALKFSTFIKCKKAALKAGGNSITVLRDCVENAGTAGSIAADSSGKIAKVVSGLNAAIIKNCDVPGVTNVAFPGSCSSAVNASTLTPCLDARVECRVCQALNDMDGLFVNCDLFDNGVADASCASGTGPTPTPTPTATATPTATLTPNPTPTATCVAGPTFRGSLANTTGRFNYNLTLGLAGANAACNTAFACSHVCSVAEMQTAEAASEFLSTPNTTFWAVDNAQPLNRQCGLTIRWDYQTADHPSFGDKISVNSGHLLGVSMSQICATTAAVGCCQ